MVFSLVHAIPEALLEKWGTTQILESFTKVGYVTAKDAIKKGVLWKGFF